MKTHLLLEHSGKRPPFKLTAGLEDCGDHFLVRYSLTDPNKVVCLDELADSPDRLMNLWEKTCFELFILDPITQHYIEFNFSPSLDWNVFYFTEYRGEKNLILSEDDLVRSIEDGEDEQIFEVEILKNHELLKKSDLTFNLTAVIKDNEGEIHYLAVNHDPEKANFHYLKGMCLKIES